MHRDEGSDEGYRDTHDWDQRRAEVKQEDDDHQADDERLFD
jgi:hypothetical protein